MPTRKIRDLEPWEKCQNPEHNPPTNYVYADGVYEHTCPGCGHVQKFVVRNPIYRRWFPHDERPWFVQGSV